MKKSSLLIFCSFLSACNISASDEPLPGRSDVQHAELRSNGQGGNTRVGWRAWRNINPHQYNIVTAPHPVRYGEFSERFEAREGDCRDTDCQSERGSGLRSEIHRDRGHRQARVNSDIWYGWSFYNESVEYRGSSYGIAPFCQRQSKSEPKGNVKCCHFGFGIISEQPRASIRATALVI